MQAGITLRPGDRQAQDFPSLGDIENGKSGQDDINVEDQEQVDIRKISSYADNFWKAHKDAPKKAAAVQQYFRDKKFTGDFAQPIAMTIRGYNVCADQL